MGRWVLIVLVALAVGFATGEIRSQILPPMVSGPFGGREATRFRDMIEQIPAKDGELFIYRNGTVTRYDGKPCEGRAQ